MRWLGPDAARTRGALLGLAREVAASALAQGVLSSIMVLVMGGSVVAILATAGRSAATEAAVLDRIDAAGTRTVTVMISGEHPQVSTALVDTIAALPLVESVVGLGRVVDATAAAIPDGERIGIRPVYGQIAGTPVDARIHPGPVVLVDPEHLRPVGLPGGAGVLRVLDGPEYPVGGSFGAPEFLAPYQPLAVIPIAPDDPTTFATIVIVATAAHNVELTTDLVRGYLVDIPPEDLTIANSDSLVALQRAISGELTSSSHAIILGVLAVTVAITLAVVTGAVLLRRKDLGRRRALGATRPTIIVLIMGQVLLLSVVATLAGVAVGLAATALSGHPPPPWTFTLAVAVAVVLAATTAAALPAVLAAHRDPLRELRVP